MVSSTRPPFTGKRVPGWRASVLGAVALLVAPLVVWLLCPLPGVAGAYASPSARRPEHASAHVLQAKGLRRTTRAPQPNEMAGADGIIAVVEAPDGRPAEGALVTCVRGERAFDTTSDAFGRFRLDAEAVGCSAIARRRDFGASEPTELRAGSEHRLRLTPPTGIAGQVVDENGAVVMHYHVAVASWEPPAGERDARLAPLGRLEVDDPQGAFVCTDLSPGSYVLAVVVGPGPVTRSQRIEVVRGSMTRGGRIVLERGGTVLGTVTDGATHGPIDGAWAMTLVGDIALRAPMSQGGQFVLEGVPVGRFDLNVVHVDYPRQALHDLEMPAGGGPVRVAMVLNKLASAR